MKRLSLVVLPFAAGLAVWTTSQPAPPAPWGANGHRIVAEIAERHLLPIARMRDMNFSISSRIHELSVSRHRRSRLPITPSKGLVVL